MKKHSIVLPGAIALQATLRTNIAFDPDLSAAETQNIDKALRNDREAITEGHEHDGVAIVVGVRKRRLAVGIAAVGADAHQLGLAVGEVGPVHL